MHVHLQNHTNLHTYLHLCMSIQACTIQFQFAAPSNHFLFVNLHILISIGFSLKAKADDSPLGGSILAVKCIGSVPAKVSYLRSTLWNKTHHQDEILSEESRVCGVSICVRSATTSVRLEPKKKHQVVVQNCGVMLIDLVDGLTQLTSAEWLSGCSSNHRDTSHTHTHTHHFRLVSFLQFLLTLGQSFESRVQKWILNRLDVDHCRRYWTHRIPALWTSRPITWLWLRWLDNQAWMNAQIAQIAASHRLFMTIRIYSEFFRQWNCLSSTSFPVQIEFVHLKGREGRNGSYRAPNEHSK